MVREFYLENETGQQFSLMDINQYCLLTNPTGLGCSYSMNYEQVGNKFVNSSKKVNQGSFSGEVNFKNYEKYFNLVNFIETSKQIKLKYIIPYSSTRETYYRDVEMVSLTKTEIQNTGVLSETINFNFTSLWYKVESSEYEITRADDEIRWDFVWNSRFLSNTSNSIDFNNQGQIPARVVIELEGYIVNPTFKVLAGSEELFNLPITATVELGEKLIFCTLENNFYIKKVNTITNEETNLYTLDNIDFDKDYILTLPVGESSLIIDTDDTLNQAKINIYTYFKAI